MPGMLLQWSGPDFVVPQVAPTDLAVGPKFERFDGLTPLDHPAGRPEFWGPENPDNPRPGMQPWQPDTYTPGPLAGVVGVIDGQPLAAARTSDRIHRPEGMTQRVQEYSTQNRRGVGQAYQGVAQTVQLQALVDNPPEPSGMTAILGGWG